jgi:hypothetical protein
MRQAARDEAKCRQRTARFRLSVSVQWQLAMAVIPKLPFQWRIGSYPFRLPSIFCRIGLAFGIKLNHRQNVWIFIPVKPGRMKTAFQFFS